MKDMLDTAYATLRCSKSDSLEKITAKYKKVCEIYGNVKLYTEAYETIKAAKNNEQMPDKQVENEEDQKFEYDMTFANMANEHKRELKEQERINEEIRAKLAESEEKGRIDEEIRAKLAERNKKRGSVRKFIDSFKSNSKNK